MLRQEFANSGGVDTKHEEAEFTVGFLYDENEAKMCVDHGICVGGKSPFTNRTGLCCDPNRLCQCRHVNNHRNTTLL